MVGAPPIVLLDEVAAHLDAGRRAALYDEICALGAQAWMTGTGPELFSELGERAQTLIVTEGDEGSVVIRLGRFADFAFPQEAAHDFVDRGLWPCG